MPNTTQLLLQYQDTAGNVSERLVSDIVYQGGDAVVAFCHLRQENRTFHISRIRSIVDPTTGEIINDLLVFLGVLSVKVAAPPPTTSSERKPLPDGVELKKLRRIEKTEFWRPFRYAVVKDLYEQKLYSLFGNRCFKCGCTSSLQIDHHIPMARGGHWIAGNLVALCSRCNVHKNTMLPSEFYLPDELQRLELVLDQEYALFDFKFDMTHWGKDRKGYLMSIGIDSELAENLLSNECHRFHIPPITASSSAVLMIDGTTILQKVCEALAAKRLAE